MKKKCNLFRLLVKALALYAAEIILVIGVVAGVFYAVGFVSELLSGAADLETGILVLFTIAGMALFIDFKRGGEQSCAKRGRNSASSAAHASGKMIKTYMAKELY